MEREKQVRIGINVRIADTVSPLKSNSQKLTGTEMGSKVLVVGSGHVGLTAMAQLRAKDIECELVSAENIKERGIEINQPKPIPFTALQKLDEPYIGGEYQPKKRKSKTVWRNGKKRII